MRGTPFHCPYCGEETLRPREATDGSSGHGTWTCESCRRAFGLRFLGLDLTHEAAEVEA